MSASRKKVLQKVLDEYEDVFGERPAGDPAEIDLLDDDEGRVGLLIQNICKTLGISEEDELDDDVADTVEDLVDALMDVWDGETIIVD